MIKSLRIHSTNNCRMENKTIGGWNGLLLFLLSYSSLTSCSPNIVTTILLFMKTLWFTNSMAHDPVGIVQSFLNDIKTVSFLRNRPVIRNNFPFRVLATMRSQILSFWGRRCLNSWQGCVSISKQFSFKISSWQSLILLSTLTWFGPPLGLCSTLSSLTYLGIILLAVDLLIPCVSAAID